MYMCILVDKIGSGAKNDCVLAPSMQKLRASRSLDSARYSGSIRTICARSHAVLEECKSLGLEERIIIRTKIMKEAVNSECQDDNQV